MMHDWLAVAAIAAVSGAAAAVLACLPGLHLCGLLAILTGIAACPVASGLRPEWFVAACAGLVSGHALAGSIPALLLAAPDDTSLLLVSPGNESLSRRLGPRAVAFTFLGGLCAAAVTAVCAIPASPVLALAHELTRAHSHWVVWTIIVFIMMSGHAPECPFGSTMVERLTHGLVPFAVGLLTFALSGLLGFVLFYRPPLPVSASCLNMLPAIAGLFAVPCLVFNSIARARIPPQAQGLGQAPSVRALVAGTAAGCLGGLFSAFFPATTGGSGSLLAGRTISGSGAATFLISQGAARFTFYTVGFILWLLPGIGTAGGGDVSRFLEPRYAACPARDCAVAVAATVVGAVAAAAAGVPLCAALARAMSRFGQDRLSVAALLAILATVSAFCGWAGIGILTAASAIGMLPVLYGAPRVNCLAVVLLPMACRLSGFGPGIARWLGIE